MEIDQNLVVERLMQQVQEYAAGRATDVARGAETPHLAALLVQKYALGVTDAVGVVFQNSRAADRIQLLADEEVAKIDPLWREHARERWSGRPADVVVAKA